MSAQNHNDPIPVKRILLVGNPNVGKSLIFNRLTGEHATVSNYPGTTVEITSARIRLHGQEMEIVDTPGMYSLSPVTEDENVAYRMIFSTRADLVLHVVDAKNIDRMLGLTLQLMEAGLPLVLVVNMADEARDKSVAIDIETLSSLTGIPVVETVATTGEGITALKDCLARDGVHTSTRIDYGQTIEDAVAEISPLLDPVSHISSRSRALLLLQKAGHTPDGLNPELEGKDNELVGILARARANIQHSVQYYVSIAVRRAADRIIASSVRIPKSSGLSIGERVSRILLNPWTGWPILAVVIYAGLYQFVGVFGAGILVDVLDNRLFNEFLLPPVNRWIDAMFPWPAVQELVTGEYGVITLAVRYAIAIVLPIVTTFFIAFGILEDSGYLPRLSFLLDGAFKRMGLNGRAIIPMVLGLGCGTMATMVTRTLETRRERMIAAMLLSLTVPCSAQLGVTLGLLSGRPGAMAAWVLVLAAVYVAAGTLTARLMPGEKPMFYMELPPMRWPSFSNVLSKTVSRVVWYVREIIPLFVLASVIIWIGQKTYLFDAVIAAMRPAVVSLGLPEDAAKAFLFGFFRRDYGAAGLYDLHKVVKLSGNQLFVACLTLTLFLPCVAQWLVLVKERGWRFAVAVALIVMVAAYGAGLLSHTVLTVTGVQL